MSLALRTAARELYDLRARNPAAFEDALGQLPEAHLRRLLTCWQLYARPNQLRPPDSLPIWLRSCGRGEGKTRSGAEETLDLCETWGADYRGIVLNKTIGDCRKINVFGESGLVACARRRGYDLRYHREDGIVYHPAGGQLFMCTPEKPDGPRGFQCNHFWWDEISSSTHAEETWMNLIYAWRLPAPLGWKRLATVTSTPKSNAITHKLIHNLKHRVTVTYGSTFDNIDNLDEDFRADLQEYEGTKIGRQETGGEYLGAMYSTFDQDVIHRNRMTRPGPLARCVVSVDPSIDDAAAADDAGIAVVGSDHQYRPHAYVLHTEAVGSHREWPRRAVRLFVEHNCGAVVAEINQGGKMIVDAIRSAADELSEQLEREIVIPVVPVWSSTSKQARAEPVGLLYEQDRIHHIGIHKAAEKELTGWAPGAKSPNLLDAIVQGVSHLLLAEKLESLRGYA